MKKIEDSKVLNVLDLLYKEAVYDKRKMIIKIPKLLFGKLKPQDANQAYLPIDKEQGEFIYDYLVSNDVKYSVEFGTSFGISTLFLGSAAKKTGGRVITSEIIATKCKTAQINFKRSGLEKYIELREGDAMETLSNLEKGIEFLLLDGWNNLYLPLLKLLEPVLSKGALIYVDNASFPRMKPFFTYVKNNENKFKSQRMSVKKGKVELITYFGN